MQDVQAMQEIQTQVGYMDKFIEKMIDYATSAGIKIVIAILIYIAGKYIIGKILKLMGKIPSINVLDKTARDYISNITKAVLYIVLIIAIVGELGVPMASVITILASAGVAVGMALQGSLSNFAGGIMLLIFRPFSEGDYIISGGEEGTVQSINTFYTKLVTVDNKIISIPNGTLMNSNISNCTAEKMRRVDLSFNISGAEPVKKVQATIMKVVVNTDKAMADPAPQVEPLAGIPGGLTYIVRVWTKTDDYWDVYFELMREITAALGTAEISGPSTPINISK